MSHEDNANQYLPSDEALSQPEFELQELHLQIAEVGSYLMSTFFPDMTWNVRQAGAYGELMYVPLLAPRDLPADYDWDHHDWEREERVLRSILQDLTGRISYYEAAYHFPDMLSAHQLGTTSSWVDMKTKGSGKSRAQIALEILAEKRKRLIEETPKFEKFLESEDFQKAFSIAIDPESGEYRISDLTLDKEHLKTVWNRLLPFQSMYLR